MVPGAFHVCVVHTVDFWCVSPLSCVMMPRYLAEVMVSRAVVVGAHFRKVVAVDVSMNCSAI